MAISYKTIFTLIGILVLGTSVRCDYEYLSDTLSEVMQAITKDAYFPVDMQKASIKALDTFSKHVDEYTRFLGPQEYKELLATTNGGYYGIGIELGPKKDDEEFLMIVKVADGGPAQKAGIKRYDKILAIDSTQVGPHSMEDNLKKIRGDKDSSSVSLTIMRDNKPQTISVKREHLPTKSSWCAYLPQQKIIYCHIGLFTHQIAQDVEKALKKGLKKKPRGIILDLRDNGGGVLHAAVDCAALFLPKYSHIVSTKNRTGKVLNRYSTSTKPIMPNRIPVMILVNQYTASSAEILAKALKIHSAQQLLSPYYYIVGTQTYGKGSVQDVRPIGSECALKLTTALYYLPDGSSIQNKGVTPDIIIKQKYPESEEIKLLNRLYRQQKVPLKVPSFKMLDHDTRRLKALKKDHQITCACNLIMLLDQAKQSNPQAIATHKKGLTWLKEHYVIPKKIKAEVLG